ncbi:MAG: ankyrin repeat domain-containing protein [Armatimonadota bacterium]
MKNSQICLIIIVLLILVSITGCGHRRSIVIYRDRSIATCVYDNDIEEIKSQIKKGVDVNKPSGKLGLLPLNCAIDKNDMNIFKFLIDNGADINAADKDGCTPLMYAASCGNTAIAKNLIDKSAKIHVKDKGGYSPLLTAIRDGHNDIAAMLLDNGADPNERMDDKDPDLVDTPLKIAVYDNNIEAVSFLLKKGADVNARVFNNSTVLFTAVRQGNVDIVKLLLSYGADINIKDKQGNTPVTFIMVAETNKKIPKSNIEELHKLLGK